MLSAFNRKLREVNEGVNNPGPSSGSGQVQPKVPSIPNKPYAGAETPTRSSGPRTQPGSSLGATRIKHHTGTDKA